MLPFSYSRFSLRTVSLVGMTVATALLVAGCETPPPAPKRGTSVRTIPRTMHNADLNWVGSYRATASCPLSGASGCTGQTLMLTLNPDSTYSLTTTTMRRSGAPYSFTSRSRFQWDGQTIVLASKDENARLRILGNGMLERIGAAGLSESEAARTPLVFRKL